MAVRVVSLDVVAVPIQLQSSLSSSSVAIPRSSRLLRRANFPRRHTTTGRVAASPSSTLKVDRPSPTAYSGARTWLTQQEAQVELAVEAPVFPDHSTTNSEQAKFATATGPSAARSRNWFQRLAASALDVVERDWIPRIEQGRPLPSTTDPRVQLEGNFAPVPEHPVEHELEVEGKIPACLEGVYLRNGANPQFPPLAGHHLFDGDGMVHAVRFNQGLASYCCRYTRTYRYQEESRAGRPVFPKPIGERHGHGGVARLLLYGARALCGLLDASRGMGTANAGLVFHNGKLLAMSEDDLPYRVRITPDGDLETQGRFDFDGQLGASGVQSMIAHPKVDPVTGELFNLSYNVLAPPFLKYFRVSADGQKSPEVDITLQQPTMVHDFAITERFVVVPDQQVVFRMEELLSGGSPVLYDGGKAARFGLLPRYDTDETRMQWFPVPDCFCFHLWNAWEEPGRDEVVVIASCMTPADSIFNESDQALASILSEIRLDRRTGRASRREIAPGLNLEAGMVAKKVVGRKSRFAYLAVAEPWPKVSGVAKVDLLAGAGSGEESVVVARIRYPDNCYGGEPCFVPRSDDPADSEDDGYIVTFMHNEGSGKSQLLVLDARSPTLAPVAKVQLPSRVPYGFHGTYVPAKELAKQAR